MSLICDAGALIALERNDDAMWRRFEAARRAGRPPRTHGGVVAQVWRGRDGRQAVLARALGAVEVVAVDDQLGRRAGVLLGRTRGSDAIDAAVVAIARHGDTIVTSDPFDLDVLVEAAGLDVDVVPT